MTTTLDKKAYVTKTAADDRQYPTVNTDSIREANKPKTIVLDSKLMLYGTNYWAHVEMAPDGTLKGKALFFVDLFSDGVQQSITGAWHTGRTSRGDSYIKYYELNIGDAKWYVTENFDYLWRGENAYLDMCHNNIGNAGTIIKKSEK